MADAGRDVYPSQFLPTPSCLLFCCSNCWKSLISHSLHHVRGFSGATESTRPLGGIFEYRFLVPDPARVGRKAQFMPNALHSAEDIRGGGSCTLSGFPDCPGSLQGAFFLGQPWPVISRAFLFSGMPSQILQLRSEQKKRRGRPRAWGWEIDAEWAVCLLGSRKSH